MVWALPVLTGHLHKPDNSEAMTHDEQFHPMQNQWSCRNNRTVGFFLKPVFSKELVLLPPCWEKTIPKCPGDILALQIWFWTGDIIKTYQAHLPITHTSLQLKNRPSKEFKLHFWHRSAEKQDVLFIYINYYLSYILLTLTPPKLHFLTSVIWSWRRAIPNRMCRNCAGSCKNKTAIKYSRPGKLVMTNPPQARLNLYGLVIWQFKCDIFLKGLYNVRIFIS